MNQSIGLVSLVVRDYDEALDFYVGKLGFELVEDTYIPAQDKRWVVVRPTGGGGACLLLAKAADNVQASRVGNQTGGRVFLFLYTDDFRRDYEAFRATGVEFVREPETEAYGTVAVFKDIYGNQWDLLEPNRNNRASLSCLRHATPNTAAHECSRSFWRPIPHHDRDGMIPPGQADAGGHSPAGLSGPHGCVFSSSNASRANASARSSA